MVKPRSVPAPQRNSNLELYRIICMLMIVAHHYVVHSGLWEAIQSNPTTPNSLFLLVFGMWGKIGVNCFLMITGYFMCTKEITWKKFLKLLLEVYFYKLLIYFCFLFAGQESVSVERILKLIMPVWDLSTNFVSCFLGFYLTIPFLNILIRNMSRKQHALLLGILLGMYSILGSIPGFYIALNYVTWFGIIYLIAAYIRLYPLRIYENNRIWGPVTLSLIALAIGSIFFMQLVFKDSPFFFVYDSHRILAVLIALSSFLWFRNLKLSYSPIINTISSATFGVLLIHDNPEVMRQWLWKETIPFTKFFSLPLSSLILLSIATVFSFYIICVLIDLIRQHLLEKPFFKWYDRKVQPATEKKDALCNQ